MDAPAPSGRSSAKRLDASVIIVMDLTALRWALFEILGAPDCHFIASFKLTVFASSTAGRTKLRLSFVDDNGTNR